MNLDIQTCFGLQGLLESRLSSGSGNKVAFINDEHQWTYQELSDIIGRVASGLLELGVQRGDRVAIVLQDSIEFVASFFAVTRLGAIAVPMNTFQTAADYDQAFAKTSPSLLIANLNNSELTKTRWLTRTDIGKVFVDSYREHGLWGDWIKTSTPILPPTPVDDTDVAFLLWTSGTTGRIAAVPHRHRDAFMCCRQYAVNVLSASASDVFLSTSRMFHAYGLGNSVFFPLFVGGTCVFIAERPTPKAALAWAKKFNVTLLFSVPTLFSLMLEASERDRDLELPSLRLAVSAAEPLSATTVIRWKHRFGVDILDGVGSTEALHIYLSARQGVVKPGSVGIPVSGYDLELRPDDPQTIGDESTTKDVGTLWIRGDSVASEYWADPASTLRSIKDGWLNTGDRFYLDEDGHFYYLGRYDSMHRIGGKWVSAVEIEMILEEEDSITDAAVIAFLDCDGLPKLCACLVLASEIYSPEAVEFRLKQLCENRLPLLKRPTIYHFVDKIPRTSTGKKQRFLLKEQIAQ